MTEEEKNAHIDHVTKMHESNEKAAAKAIKSVQGLKLMTSEEEEITVTVEIGRGSTQDERRVVCRHLVQDRDNLEKFLTSEQSSIEQKVKDSKEGLRETIKNINEKFEKSQVKPVEKVKEKPKSAESEDKKS